MTRGNILVAIVLVATLLTVVSASSQCKPKTCGPDMEFNSVLCYCTCKYNLVFDSSYTACRCPDNSSRTPGSKSCVCNKGYVSLYNGNPLVCVKSKTRSNKTVKRN